MRSFVDKFSGRPSVEFPQFGTLDFVAYSLAFMLDVSLREDKSLGAYSVASHAALPETLSFFLVSTTLSRRFRCSTHLFRLQYSEIVRCSSCIFCYFEILGIAVVLFLSYLRAASISRHQGVLEAMVRFQPSTRAFICFLGLVLQGDSALLIKETSAD